MSIRRRRLIRVGAFGGASATAQIRNLLFSAGEQGLIYYPKPVVDGDQVLWEMSDGTVAVDEHDDPIGRADDISGNDNHTTQTTAGSKPFYKTDGTLHWAESDGVDDFLGMDIQWGGATSGTFCMGVRDLGSDTIGAAFFKQTGSTGSQGDIGVWIPRTSTTWAVRVHDTSNEDLQFDAPSPGTDNVLTFVVRFDAVSPMLRVRLNGSDVAEISSPSGTVFPIRAGMYALFDRVGASVPGSLRIYGMVGVEGVATESAIGDMESYIADISGVTL